MGKKIDFFVLTAGITAALYLYFRTAFENNVVSLILALLCCMVLRHTLRKVFRRIGSNSYVKKRRMRRHTASAMMHLACMDATEAQKKLADLIEKVYGDSYETVLIPLHPASSLEQDDVFKIWKQNRNRERLVICTTAHASASCRTMAAELRQPKLALVDADALSQLIAEHPKGFFPPEEKQVQRKIHLRRWTDLLINRRNAPRCILMFASMLTIYLLSANLFYLAAALFLLFVALLSLRRQNRPAKLF